ncbi:TRAP transporter small permease [Halalkalibacter okhensis]|uniref:C4-dicarboxylate ABC transporter permease n=1 Tax=Halalkalibacter okhensis TaxID=333138 RepID=A0A0B0IFX2_9BACI|nr:TRAP transporter small permease [Halalkalibacter okhensis]KHF38944.1 C4-dicarboxylate ABC transporter permease [Halalkalibacter okhensis]
MGKVLNGLNKLLNGIIALFLMTMVFLVFSNVVLRYLFDSGITWSEELARFLFVWVVFLGAIVAYKEKSHLGVDIFIGALPAKAQKVLYIFINLVVLVVLVVVIHGGYYLMEINHTNYGPATGIPLSFIFSAGVLAAVVMAIMSIMQTIRYVVYGQDLPSWAAENKDPLTEKGR